MFALVTTQVAQVPLYKAPNNVLYMNGPYPEQGADILKLSYRIFHMCNRTGGTCLNTSPNAPLLYKPQITEIYKIPEGDCWAQYGITYVHQPVTDQALRI